MSRKRNDIGFDLPKRVEAIPRKNGAYSYRYLTPNGPKVNLGMNYEEAIARYELLVGASNLPTGGSTVSADEIWKRHRKGAKQRNKTFSITLEDVQQLLDSQNNRCAITGIRFNSLRPEGARMRPWAASIDRIKSAQGYERGNVRLVCAFANVAMNDFGEEILMTFFEKIIRRSVREELLDALKDLGISSKDSLLWKDRGI